MGVYAQEAQLRLGDDSGLEADYLVISFPSADAIGEGRLDFELRLSSDLLSWSNHKRFGFSIGSEGAVQATFYSKQLCLNPDTRETTTAWVPGEGISLGIDRISRENKDVWISISTIDFDSFPLLFEFLPRKPTIFYRISPITFDLYCRTN